MSAATTASTAAPAGATTPSRLSAHDLTVGYRPHVIASNLDLELPEGAFTVIIGPNACGKSTLLRTLARILDPLKGHATLNGRNIDEYRPKEFARLLTLLPQQVVVPEGITVADLVSRGRFPHQGLLRQWSPEDERVVRRSLDATGVSQLGDRVVGDLSGGQRQRVLLAMALAQDTGLMLLDEPTTYLDITHQIEVLELCRELRADGRTIVAVLHDLQMAARYADHIVAMNDGSIIAQGSPREVFTPELIERTFGLRARVLTDPESGTPLVVPLAGRAALAPSSSLAADVALASAEPSASAAPAASSAAAHRPAAGE